MATVPELEQVIDFGVMCGYPLWELSRSFPEKFFIGCDRQPEIKTWNDQYFVEDNLQFIAGDILEVLPDVVQGKQTLLYHVRTTTLC